MSQIPGWIKAELFENVLCETVPEYREIKEFRVYNALGPGENYVAIALKVQIQVLLNDNTTHTQNYFLKVAHDTDLYNTLMYKWNVFNKETEVYRVFIPDFEEMYREVGVDVRFGPHCYVLPVEQEYLLLEDVSLRGFKNANRQNSLDMEHCKCALKKLAQWHAASAVRVERKGPYNEIYLKGSINPDGEPLIRSMSTAGIRNVLKVAQNLENKDIYYAELERLSEGFCEFLLHNVEFDPLEFNVLNHGDFWCNNMMFQYDDDIENKIRDVYLVDYQMARYASPGDDIIYFLFTSVKLGLKVACFDELVRYYYDHLIDNLILLKYSKKLPTLAGLHKMIMESKAYVSGTFAAFNIMPTALADPVDSATLDNLVNDSEHNAQVYQQERVKQHLELVLPWMYYKGFLDCN
ncbi:uncharacterized protein LOC133338478 [Musca vetustissima]|uniref:uncharacterized protein LOC133338478 n=1 Tax=Musca vetustissima TaxID=27455 RepID=UPI002AB6A5F2|nr:uncharacterized protein LOC133338478 [Musca vetustissima]